jgi:hypothetical protein
MIGVLHDACRRADIPVSSMWAAAPHYLAAAPNIKVTAALLTYLNDFLSLGLNLSGIQADAMHFEEQISTLVARDPEASAYVQKLEEQAANLLDEEELEESQNDDEEEDDSLPGPDETASTGPLPSADTLIRSVEELLRQERENHLQHLENEDNENEEEDE